MSYADGVLIGLTVGFVVYMFIAVGQAALRHYGDLTEIVARLWEPVDEWFLARREFADWRALHAGDKPEHIIMGLRHNVGNRRWLESLTGDEWVFLCETMQEYENERAWRIMGGLRRVAEEGDQ